MNKLNLNQTIICLPDDIPWKVPHLPDGAPEQSVAEAILAGSEDETGMYLVLMKWYPGYMSCRQCARFNAIAPANCCRHGRR